MFRRERENNVEENSPLFKRYEPETLDSCQRVRVVAKSVYQVRQT